jgi:hypothetical protein
MLGTLGAVATPDPPSPPQALINVEQIAAVPKITILCFMFVVPQSLALVGEPASGVLTYGKIVR